MSCLVSPPNQTKPNLSKWSVRLHCALKFNHVRPPMPNAQEPLSHYYCHSNRAPTYVVLTLTSFRA